MIDFYGPAGERIWCITSDFKSMLKERREKEAVTAVYARALAWDINRMNDQQHFNIQWVLLAIAHWQTVWPVMRPSHMSPPPVSDDSGQHACIMEHEDLHHWHAWWPPNWKVTTCRGRGHMWGDLKGDHACRCCRFSYSSRIPSLRFIVLPIVNIYLIFRHVSQTWVDILCRNVLFSENNMN